MSNAVGQGYGKTTGLLQRHPTLRLLTLSDTSCTCTRSTQEVVTVSLGESTLRQLEVTMTPLNSVRARSAPCKLGPVAKVVERCGDDVRPGSFEMHDSSMSPHTLV